MPGQPYTITWKALLWLQTLNCSIQVSFVFISPSFSVADTDSVIFLGPRNQPVPFEEGSMLGQMKNEYPPHMDIQCFYSGGYLFFNKLM